MFSLGQFLVKTPENLSAKLDLADDTQQAVEANIPCTIPRVALVTGSEKSPPGGLTAPTILTLPSRSGLPRAVTLPARS